MVLAGRLLVLAGRLLVLAGRLLVLASLRQCDSFNEYNF